MRIWDQCQTRGRQQCEGIRQQGGQTPKASWQSALTAGRTVTKRLWRQEGSSVPLCKDSKRRFCKERPWHSSRAPETPTGCRQERMRFPERGFQGLGVTFPSCPSGWTTGTNTPPHPSRMRAREPRGNYNGRTASPTHEGSDGIS